MLDPQWEMLLDRARNETDKLSNGNVVVLLTAKGTVASVLFQDLNSAIEAEGAMKVLDEMKKNEDTSIERLICMWHDGSVDVPSFAFREALLCVDSANLSTQMLLNGLNEYIVKTIKATMPKGHNV